MSLFLCYGIHLVTVSALLNYGQFTQTPKTATNTNLLWQELFNMQKQINSIQKENGNLKVQLDKIQKENEELKSNQNHSRFEIAELRKNQSDLSLEVERLKKSCKCNQTDAIFLRDNETLSSIKGTLSEPQINPTAAVSLPFTMNANIETLKSLQRATASIVSSLQGEQIASRLLVDEIQRNLSDIINYVGKLQNRLHNINGSLSQRLTSYNTSFQTSLRGKISVYIICFKSCICLLWLNVTFGDIAAIYGRDMIVQTSNFYVLPGTCAVSTKVTFSVLVCPNMSPNVWHAMTALWSFQYYMVVFRYYMVVFCYYMVVFRYYMVVFCYYMVVFYYYMVVFRYYMVVLCYYMVVLCYYMVVFRYYMVFFCYYMVVFCYHMVVFCLYDVKVRFKMLTRFQIPDVNYHRN